MPFATADPRISPHKALENGPQAALLSYLVPGMGQMYQGRIGKGILFFLCIYALFFYGQWLGSGTAHIDDKDYNVTSNVYLPHTAHLSNPWNLPDTLADLYNRPHFLGQFWVGIVAWPAIWQYLAYDPVHRRSAPAPRLRAPAARGCPSATRNPERQDLFPRLGLHGDRRCAQHHGHLRCLRWSGLRPDAGREPQGKDVKALHGTSSVT